MHICVRVKFTFMIGDVFIKQIFIGVLITLCVGWVVFIKRTVDLSKQSFKLYFNINSILTVLTSIKWHISFTCCVSEVPNRQLFNSLITI